MYISLTQLGEGKTNKSVEEQIPKNSCKTIYIVYRNTYSFHKYRSTYSIYIEKEKHNITENGRIYIRKTR